MWHNTLAHALTLGSLHVPDSNGSRLWTGNDLIFCWVELDTLNWVLVARQTLRHTHKTFKLTAVYSIFTVPLGGRCGDVPWCSWPCSQPTGWPCSPLHQWRAGGRSSSPRPDRTRRWSEPQTPLWANKTWWMTVVILRVSVLHLVPQWEEPHPEAVGTHEVATRSWWRWQKPWRQKYRRLVASCTAAT